MENRLINGFVKCHFGGSLKFCVNFWDIKTKFYSVEFMET